MSTKNRCIKDPSRLRTVAKQNTDARHPTIPTHRFEKSTSRYTLHAAPLPNSIVLSCVLPRHLTATCSRGTPPIGPSLRPYHCLHIHVRKTDTPSTVKPVTLKRIPYLVHNKKTPTDYSSTAEHDDFSRDFTTLHTVTNQTAHTTNLIV